VSAATVVVTGFRFSEIRAVEKRDLDLKTSGLWVRRSLARKEIGGTPKNERARFQVIPRRPPYDRLQLCLRRRHNQKMIATLLGHAHTGSTERYVHMQVDQTQPLVEARWARLTACQSK